MRPNYYYPSYKYFSLLPAFSFRINIESSKGTKEQYSDRKPMNQFERRNSLPSLETNGICCREMEAHDSLSCIYRFGYIPPPFSHLPEVTSGIWNCSHQEEPGSSSPLPFWWYLQDSSGLCSVLLFNSISRWFSVWSWDFCLVVCKVADMHFANGVNTRCRDVLDFEFEHCSDLNTSRFLKRMVEAENPDFIAFTGPFNLAVVFDLGSFLFLHFEVLFSIVRLDFRIDSVLCFFWFRKMVGHSLYSIIFMSLILFLV